MIKRIEITGLPGTNMERVLNVLKQTFNIDVVISSLFEEAILMPENDLDDEAIQNLVIQKVDKDALYFIIDDTPEHCISELKKYNIDINDPYYNLDSITKYRKQYLTVYQYCRGEYIDNVIHISKLIPNYMELIINHVKKFVK